MIQVKVSIAGTDNEFASIYMREAPRKGEFLWFPASSYNRLDEAFGTSSFKVKDVAHWVDESWNPNTHVGDPIHSVCAYVEPVGMKK